tara:strand:+ start:1437 stop:1619 length:183 start_codon:yes stop_codon:yes gene_type:complete
MQKRESIIIRPAELAELLGVSQTTVWRWRKQKILQEPIKLGSRLVGWRKEDIDEWLARQK